MPVHQSGLSSFIFASSPKLLSLIKLVCLVSVFVVLCCWPAAHAWPRHNVSTLRLLQIVHTHGDRTPSHFVHNDPYADFSLFWREGVGQLTKKGRNRMYRVGQFFRDAYRDFLLNLTAPMEEYLHVRSSGSKRCLESTSLLATGMFGSLNKNRSKDNSSIAEYESLTKYGWRPIPIHSMYPKGSDAMLDAISSAVQCPNAESEYDDMQLKSERMKRIFDDNADFLEEVSLYAGERIDTLLSAYELYQELFIERQFDYHWWKMPFEVWTEDYETYVVSKLRELSRLYWSVQWDNKLLQTLRAGLLIKELNTNIRNHISGLNQTRKVFIYSTHDTKIALLLHAFGLFNGYLIPPGATLLLELHHQQESDHTSTAAENGYFLRMYYFNETYSSDWAYQMVSDRICLQDRTTSQWKCPVQHYLKQTAAFEPYDWTYQCGLRLKPMHYFTMNLFILGTNFVCLLLLFVLLRIYSSQIRTNR